tara:strand:- start:1037 stop:1525 length:489 start_codon:yes stop_codon:yes gene_type:complete
MADDIRQKIMDEVVVRFTTITTANGYETNIGSSVSLWRDLKSTPLVGDEPDAVNIMDVTTLTDKSNQPVGTALHTMEIRAEAATQDTSMARDKKVRKMLADMVKAIGTDRKWTVSGTTLAWDTSIESSEIDVEQGGEIVGQCQLVFNILYRTLDFDPYNERH